MNLPPQMEITSGLVSKLQVRIRGTSNQVRSLNVGRLAYKLDLGKISVGTNVIPLVPESMTITSAVEVVEIKSKFTRRAQRDYIYRRRLFIDLIAEPKGYKFTEIITPDSQTEYPLRTKKQLAEDILDAVLDIRKQKKA